jgi:hypothetical protein
LFCELTVTHDALAGAIMQSVKADRRETTSRSPDAPPPPTGSERRSPALIVQVRDVAALVAIITLLDTIAKLLLSCG